MSARPGHASAILQTLHGRRLAEARANILTPLDAIDAIEAAMQHNQGTHGERWRTRPALHHMKKGLGHALAAGPRGTNLDDDSGHPHLVLAATRLVLAVAVTLDHQDAP